jgi:phosphoglycolate phosphatase
MDREQAYMHRHPCQVAYPGVRETLEALAEKYRLFLVSNAERGYPELLLEKLGVERLFQGHLCYGDTLLCKGDTIRILMQRHNIGSAAYIGDTQGDLEAAEKAGIGFIFAAYGFGAPDHWDLKIEKISDLLTAPI